MDIQDKMRQVNTGIRPYHLFDHFKSAKDTSIQIEAIDMLLQDRVKFFSYPREDYDQSFKYSSIVDFLYEETDGIAIKFANHLRNSAPDCLWGSYGRVIFLHDIVSPWKMDDITYDYDYDRFVFDNNSTKNGARTIFCSDEWFALIDNHSGDEDEPIDVYLCKLKR